MCKQTLEIIDQQVLECTHRSLFNDSVEHYNSFGALLPNHQPEMTTGIPQRPLWKREKGMYTESKSWRHWRLRKHQSEVLQILLQMVHRFIQHTVKFCRHVQCLCYTIPEKGCKLFGLPPPWLNLHWCSHFQSFQVLPDCDHLKPDKRWMSNFKSQKRLSQQYFLIFFIYNLSDKS